MGATYLEVLKDSAGNPIPGVMVVLYLAGVKIASDTTEKEGKVTFTDLATGHYELRFFGRGFTTNDTKFVSVIDEITSTNFRPEIRLERILSVFNAIDWPSRAIIESCIDESLSIGSNTMSLRDSIIQPPVGALPNTTYTYRTRAISLNLGEVVATKAVLQADYVLVGSADIKIETTLSGVLDDYWYTWLDTQNTTVIGSGEYWADGYFDLTNIEVTNSGLVTSGIIIPGFVPGDSVALRVSITTDSVGNGGYLTSISLFTNPDLWYESRT